PPAAPPPAAPARSQNGRPDNGRPENGRPENGRPQFARPENGRPEPARPTLAPSGTPLHRRVPGVALDAARGDSPFATASLSSQQADPEQVRALVEQFEAGIFRALGEVRNNPNSEGTTR
ncbi:MAG TPA: hypothetical protein VHA75_03635, partial [Rugosimonospora sp.]|nr:hypothetical protein [Rugosimonospora sp.]